MASCLVLAALAVPIFSRGDGVSEYSGIEAHKMKEMAALLGYHFSPKRSSLMEQLVSMNLLELCHPQIQKLFDILENGKRPMSMVEEVVPLIKSLREDKQYSKYADGIDELLVVRTLEQLAKVSINSIFHSLPHVEHNNRMLLDGMTMTKLFIGAV